ncbi:MAG: alpha-N-acetylglucosaminidase [Gemmatimonadaceae bacterium]
MRTRSLLLLLAMLTAPPAAATPTSPPSADVVKAASSLIQRVVPGQAAHFVVEQIAPEAGRDVFEVESRGDRVVLRGSNGVAVASALNWYLEHVAGITIAIPLRPIALALPLPRVRAKVRIVTPYKYRYFFNYCTFSYSMAWWDWPQWQQMIDWMALKGINLPLSATGQEATWRLTLRDLGFSEQMIADFLVGPAYLPWGWMGNIDGLGGPLPASWIDSHIALERRILARERELGMTPVLQAFTGHVPASIKQVFPDAKIHQTGDWSAGFSGTWFLDPLDPLFQRIGKRFVERQTELYGTDHVYAADSFNEINPPSDDPAFLAGMGRAVYNSMHSADSSAVWVLQGWFLYYQAKFWKEPQARALIGAVADDRMIVLDLWGDRHPVWQARDAFYGKPWIWNVLYNFGGKVNFNGDLPSIAANLATAVNSPKRGKLAGIGMMMEGLGYNPIVPDFVMDMAWRSAVPALQPWAAAWVDRRYGGPNAHATNAWKLLMQTAYKSAPQTGTFLAERPGFYVKGTAYRTEPLAPYDVKTLAAALDTLLAARDELGRTDAYRYDVVNLTRQVLGQLGLPLVNEVESAYKRNDRPALSAAESRMLALIEDLDVLVGTREEFLLGRWLEDAKRWATTRAERDLYEWNARNIITLWGTKCTEGQNDDLNLYAYKEWQGMFSSYYLPRWKEFFVRLNASLDSNTPFDRAPFAADMCRWEQEWSRRHDAFATSPRGDAVETAVRLYDKYRADLVSRVGGRR